MTEQNYKQKIEAIDKLNKEIDRAQKLQLSVIGGDIAKSNYQIAIANMYSTLAMLIVSP